MSEKLQMLQRCSLFARLDRATAQQLADRARLRTFPAGQHIFLSGEAGESVFLLVEGLVKVCHVTPDGKQSILAFVEPGEMFGALGFLGCPRSDEQIETIGPSTVMVLPSELMRSLVRDQSSVASQIARMVAQRCRRVEQRLKTLLFLSNRDRLVHLLLDLAERFGNRTQEGVQIGLRLSHQELANLIGSTRETVTVVLGQLRAEGAVDGGRRRIVLLDAKGLAEGVGRSPLAADRSVDSNVARVPLSHFAAQRASGVPQGAFGR